jgi:drug/metabolite transporter (DMT)-like permease
LRGGRPLCEEIAGAGILWFFIAVVAAGVSVATIVCLGLPPVLLLVLGAVRRRRLPPIGRVLVVAVAVAGLLLVSIAGGVDQAPDSAAGIVAVAYALLYTGLRSTPSGTAIIATLVEPVTAVLIAVLLLGERLSPAGLAGSLLIVVAISGLGRTENELPPQ